MSLFPSITFEFQFELFQEMALLECMCSHRPATWIDVSPPARKVDKYSFPKQAVFVSSYSFPGKRQFGPQLLFSQPANANEPSSPTSSSPSKCLFNMFPATSQCLNVCFPTNCKISEVLCPRQPAKGSHACCLQQTATRSKFTFSRQRTNWWTKLRKLGFSSNQHNCMLFAPPTTSIRFTSIFSEEAGSCPRLYFPSNQQQVV